MIRRIRIASNHPLVEVCRSNGYHVEFQKDFDGTDNKGTSVVEFPFAYPEGTKLAEEMTAVDQLEVVRRLQTEWSDNAVSCTVYYKMEELEDIKAYLKKNYNKNFKSLSFLLHKGHGFIQAPMEAISEDEYNKLVSTTKLITSIDEVVEFQSDDECSTGFCPVK